MRLEFINCLAAAVLTFGPAAAAQTVTGFQAGDGGWQLASPAVGNIDNDPALEIVTAYRNSSGQWLLDVHKPSGARVPGWPFNSGFDPMNVSPTLADLDGDGRAEILTTAGSSILAFRGDGSLLWRHTVTSDNYVPNAGFQAVTNGFYLHPSGTFQPRLPPTAEFSSEVSPPLVADLEGDGSLEVLTAWKIKPDRLSSTQDFNPFINDIFGLNEWGATGEVWSGGVIISDARTGTTEFIYHFHQLVEAGLAVAQLDSDPALEVLVLNDADSIVAFDITQPPGLWGEGMLHKKFGKNLRLLSGSYLRGADVQAADIDGDGLDEVLVASTQIDPNWQPSESILDDDGALIWREWRGALSIPAAHGWFNSSVLIPVNADGDNRIDVLGFTQSHEITFRTWNGVELVARPGWPQRFAPQLPSPPAVGDVDGDGVQEIVIATYDPARTPSAGELLVYSLGGDIKYSVDILGGAKHIPVIADLNSDGTFEVLVRSLTGRIHIVMFGSGGLGPASWSMHRGNAGRNRRGGLYPSGTPVITRRSGSHGRVSFDWQVPAGRQPASFRILRAESPDGAFAEIAQLPGSARSFTLQNVPLGQQLIFEVHAVYLDRVVPSAPFAVRSDLNRNLIRNGGFEEDDDSNWDKWFSGDIVWADMLGSETAPRSGNRAMQIRLQNKNSGSSITQYSHYGVPEDYLPVTPGTLYSFGGFIRATPFNQTSSHWFEWDSSKTAENTNARPALQWPNYFTPAIQTSAAETPWTYLNRVFEMPAGFPNVQLRHRYRNAAPATGSVFLDDVFFRPLPDPASPAWQIWISFGSTWRHFTSEPPANWRSPAFDDSAWPEARAKFGHGSGPANIVTPVPKNRPAYYFRKTFQAKPGADEMLLAALCTDDYGGVVYPLRIWINGREIPGPVEAVSGDGNVVKYFDLAPFADFFVAGPNLIAVQLDNTWQPTWDNVAFDLSLSAMSAPAAAIDSVTLAANQALQLRVRAELPSAWRIEKAASVLSPWAALTNLHFASPGVQDVTLPRSESRMFYRLIQIE